METYDKVKLGIKEDKWVNSICSVCHYSCGVRVHIVDGVAVGIEGLPGMSWGSKGGLCGKSAGQLQVLYDPNRVNYPVRRGNPEKGIGVDPKWQRISWDEAMNEIVDRLGKILREKPSRFGVTSGVRVGPGEHYFIASVIFAAVYGASFVSTGAGLYCGMATHDVAALNHASWRMAPDFFHGNYTIYFGDQIGVGGHYLNVTARARADGVARGMKIVVFDPLCHNVAMAGKEWIPILPGTDLIVALAMANILVNELGIYDREHLKRYTDAPYLVQENGLFLRDDSGEPLLWDLADNTAKNWKQPIGNAALEGTYEVRGVKVRPAFAVMKEHLRQYTAERASEVSTVPASTIRRIATEFGQEARIGSTIEIQGVKMPYRPVSAIQFRSGSAHTNAFHQQMAVDLLNQLVGASDVPGGCIGYGPAVGYGSPEKGLPTHGPVVSKDGYMSVQLLPGRTEWPHHDPEVPTNFVLNQLFTSMALPCHPFTLMKGGPELYRKLGIDPQLDALLVVAANLMKNFGSQESVAEYLKTIPFVVCYDIFQNETTEGFADIVLPSAAGLESLEFTTPTRRIGMAPYCLLDNAFPVRQPVVAPMYERRDYSDFLTDLIHRLGLTRQWNSQLNLHFCKFCGHPDIFGLDEKLSWSAVADRFLQALFGPEKGLDWFKEHGYLAWPKKIDEAYWRPFHEGRAHIYMDYLVGVGDKVKAICEPRDIKIDWEQYTPLISWFPPIIQKEKDAEHDLYLVTFTDSLHAGSWTHGIPWMAEVSDTTGYHYTILMNPKTAAARGIKDGDTITIENKYGHSTSGVVHIIEGIHPECIGTIYGTGKWARGQPLARGKGANTAVMTEVDLEHICPITVTPEAAIVVKVSKGGTSK
ncbi:MAG: molybdopterin-dependent oxidoreductase [Chloroflexi bacterium]|nr:molybdopterin-dependent oxidoreductase [Chloroflexota bacterium]